jgi:hypothetical protein
MVQVECDDVTGVAGCGVKLLVIPGRDGYVPGCFPPFPPTVAVARYLPHLPTTADDHRKSMTACKVCKPALRAAYSFVGAGQLGSTLPLGSMAAVF